MVYLQRMEILPNTAAAAGVSTSVAPSPYWAAATAASTFALSYFVHDVLVQR